VFRPPQKGESYVIGADPSEGIAKKRMAVLGTMLRCCSVQQDGAVC
jgi:hypothetical protein